MKAKLITQIVDFKPIQHLDKKVHETATEVITQHQYQLDPGFKAEDGSVSELVIVSISQPCVLPNVLKDEHGHTRPQPLRPSIGMLINPRARNRTVATQEWWDSLKTPTPAEWLQSLGYEV